MSESCLQIPKIADSILDLIGRTPCVRLGRVGKEHEVVANIVLKLESMEPCSSVKDRIAKSMIIEAEKRGEIKPGETVLVEPTSGNTGIGLAMVAAARGYEIILTMPQTYSLERRVMLKALGAKLVLTPGEEGIAGTIIKCEEIIRNLKGRGYMLQQFNNPDNPKIHRETTGPEIWEQTDGSVDILVGGVGTGGTITGAGQFLRSKKADMKIVAVEPRESAVLSGEAPGPHKIQGIGPGFIPKNCDTTLIDEVIPVTADRSIEIARALAVKEGIFVGISAGSAIAAAIELGQRAENTGKTIVVIIPSFGERYLSTALFTDLHAEAVAQKVEKLQPTSIPPEQLCEPGSGEAAAACAAAPGSASKNTSENTDNCNPGSSTAAHK